MPESVIGAWEKGLKLGENLEDSVGERSQQRPCTVFRVQWVISEAVTFNLSKDVYLGISERRGGMLWEYLLK